MIACVSPVISVVEDTISTLHFASRAKSIHNHAKVNLQSSGSASNAVLAQYEAQLAQLRQQLADAERSRSTEVSWSLSPPPSPLTHTISHPHDTLSRTPQYLLNLLQLTMPS